MSAISSTTSATDPTLQMLSQQDFLKLLVTQMTSQDPMNPESNIDFSAQMAQFSTLQATTAMQTSIAQLGAQQQFLQANDLIGRSVTLANTDQTVSSGVVGGVQVEAGVPKLIVNGQSYDLSQVLSVAQISQPSTLDATNAMQTSIAQLGVQQELLQANDLIGRSVAMRNSDLTVTNGVVSAVQVEAGTPKLVVNGQSYDLSQMLSVAPAQLQP